MFNLPIIDKIKTNKYFLEIYCFLLVIIIFLLRQVDNQSIITFLLIISSVTLILFNDVKYLVPVLIYFPISCIKGFSDSGVSILFIMSIILTIITLILYFVLNKIKFKIKTQGWIFLVIAISTVIPIIWYTPVDTLKDSSKFMYFMPFLYFAVYVFTTTAKERMYPVLVKAMCYLPLLIMLQCMYYVLTTEGFEIGDGVLLGWGGGNHSSMLLCVALPFIIYRFLVEKNKILPIILGVLSIVALIFTNSRGGYLFFGLEVVLFGIYWVIVNRKKKSTYIITAGAVAIGLVALVILFDKLNLKDTIFEIGFSDAGRFNIYNKGISLFFESFRNFIFGRGLINDYLWSGKVLFYHNNIVQFVVTGGIILLIIMIYHYIKKYGMLFKKRNIFTMTMFIGFLVVDLYGLTDSTYFTYYYMIITAVMYACFDNEIDYLNEIHTNNEIIEIDFLKS